MKMKTTINYFLTVFGLILLIHTSAVGQMIQLPDGGVNLTRKAGARVGVTDIEIDWNAPGVKGREGSI